MEEDPLKLVKTVTAMDYGAIVRDPSYVLDQDRVRRYQKHLQAGRAMPPVFVSSAGCKCLDGEHRLEAAKLEGVMTGPACVFEPSSIGDARIFQLQTNGERRGLTPEETAELVELLAAEEAANDAVNGNSESNFPNSDAAPKKRGRKKTAEGKAIDRVAKESGVTPAAVRQRVKKAKEPEENTASVSAEMLKPPPSVASVIGRALVDLGAAAEKLEEAFRRMDAIAGEYGDKDSRWAVSGYTGRAMVLARQAKSDAETAAEHITSVETAKKGYSSRKTPVSGLYVGYGKDFHIQARIELGLAEPKSQVARDAKKAAAGPPPPGEPVESDPTRMALARSAFARAELQAREKFPDRPPRSTTPEGEDPPVSSAQAARERRAAEKARREDEANGAPKTGLGGARLQPEKALDIELEQPDGSEVRYVPDQEEVVQVWGEADALGLGPDGEEGDGEAF